jgi:hypothetical protein
MSAVSVLASGADNPHPKTVRILAKIRKRKTMRDRSGVWREWMEEIKHAGPHSHAPAHTGTKGRRITTGFKIQQSSNGFKMVDPLKC